MKKRKYAIKKEFFPYSSFTAPRSPIIIKLAQKWMKVPRYFLHDKEVEAKAKTMKGCFERRLSYVKEIFAI